MAAKRTPPPGAESDRDTAPMNALMVAIDKLARVEAQANEWIRLSAISPDPYTQAVYKAHAKQIKEILDGDNAEE